MLATQQDLGDDSELTYLLEKLEACLPPESDAAPAPAKAGPKGRRKESAAQTGKVGALSSDSGVVSHTDCQNSYVELESRASALLTVKVWRGK